MDYKDASPLCGGGGGGGGLSRGVQTYYVDQGWTTSVEVVVAVPSVQAYYVDQGCTDLLCRSGVDYKDASPLCGGGGGALSTAAALGQGRGAA